MCRCTVIENEWMFMLATPHPPMPSPPPPIPQLAITTLTYNIINNNNDVRIGNIWTSRKPKRQYYVQGMACSMMWVVCPKSFQFSVVGATPIPPKKKRKKRKCSIFVKPVLFYCRLFPEVPTVLEWPYFFPCQIYFLEISCHSLIVLANQIRNWWQETQYVAGYVCSGQQSDNLTMCLYQTNPLDDTITNQFLNFYVAITFISVDSSLRRKLLFTRLPNWKKVKAVDKNKGE